MNNIEEHRKNAERIGLAVLFVLLVCWSWPFVGNGVDVRDTGSYLTKYRYIFNPDIHVNEIHYFLGEVAGGVIYALTPVHKVLALNVASSILYIATALLLYFGLKRFLPKVPLLACVLTGTFYGITWIRTLNWNAWTSLWLTVGLLLLLRGLEKGSQKCLAMSGFVLAVNTYFRMPNMLFLALIVVIFWKELLDILEEEDGHIRELFRGKSIARIIRSCRWFFAGAVLGAAAGLILALLILGPDTVLHNLAMLTSVGAGENEGNTHSITTGIYLFLLGMRDGAKAWVLYGACVLILWAGAVGLGRRQKQTTGRGCWFDHSGRKFCPDSGHWGRYSDRPCMDRLWGDCLWHCRGILLLEKGQTAILSLCVRGGD